MGDSFTCDNCSATLPIEFAGRTDCEEGLTCARCVFAPDPPEPGRIFPTEPRIRNLVIRQKKFQEGAKHDTD